MNTETTQPQKQIGSSYALYESRQRLYGAFESIDISIEIYPTRILLFTATGVGLWYCAKWLKSKVY
jgi:hypothetical protein